jgi:hypothetical protein
VPVHPTDRVPSESRVAVGDACTGAFVRPGSRSPRRSRARVATPAPELSMKSSVKGRAMGRRRLRLRHSRSRSRETCRGFMINALVRAGWLVAAFNSRRAARRPSSEGATHRGASASRFDGLCLAARKRRVCGLLARDSSGEGPCFTDVRVCGAALGRFVRSCELHCRA